MGWIYPAMANALGIWIEDIGGAGRGALANFSAGLSRLKRQCPKQAAV
jgi:hypothetical protein